MKRKTINNLWVVGVLLIAGFCLSACNSGLDIQQAYEFDIRTMPVRKEIRQNETVEIRCSLIEKGTFADNQYNIRFFQSEGYGDLRLGKEGKAFLPNDRYPLPEKKFRLYYTSKSDESQKFEVVIEDGFGNEKKLEFSFSNEKQPDPSKRDSAATNLLFIEKPLRVMRRGFCLFTEISCRPLRPVLSLPLGFLSARCLCCR